MMKWDFYQNHLDHVSRSFSFCIKQLDSPLKEWVGISYILFRMLDIIEDSKWFDIKDQKNLFSFYLRALNDEKLSSRLVSLFPSQISTYEMKLIHDAPFILKDLSLLPNDVRSMIKSSVNMMARGMEYFVNMKDEKGNLRLNNIFETNQYCFFVAGIVGELLTQLAQTAYEEEINNQEMIQRSFHFGLFLQKINLLKDQLVDEKEGRWLLPDRQATLDSLYYNSKQGLDYIINLPFSWDKYRIFCGWSLFLGIKSLKYIELSWENKNIIKIPRDDTVKLLDLVTANLNHPSQLISLFNELIPKQSQSTLKDESHPSETYWLSKIYHLPKDNFIDLGLIPASP